MRKLFIAGNWKMNMDLEGSRKLVADIKAGLGGTKHDIGVFPPFVYLPAVVDAAKGSKIVVGAQNMHHEASGAFTGEVSGKMIQNVGGTHVILGHSERRQLFHETDAFINRKLKAALALGLGAIVCVGETRDERDQNVTEQVVGGQLNGSLAGITPEQAEKVTLAYEPVWAIGTGLVATPKQAEEVHKFIRRNLAQMFGEATAQKMRIQYGGSVKPDNAAELLSIPDIDGALIGGAALNAKSFLDIIHNAKEK